MVDPTVSAVVATRDRPELLRRAIASILGQDYAGTVECLVVFDRSDPQDLSDLDPGDRLRSLKVLRNDRTPGLAGARNAGATAASGELLAFCDDDDEWRSDKLRRQVAALRADPAVTTVTAGIELVSGDRATIRTPQGDRVTLPTLLRSRAAEVHPSTILVRRDAFFERIGPVDETIPGSYGEDYEWLLRAASANPIAVVREPLVRVHWHAGSHFADRWRTIADAIGYLVAKHPEVAADPRNRARLYGRVAFAHAALGEGREARGWAWRSLRAWPLERRPWLALGVSLRLVDAATVQRWANRTGRGI
ncbi:MAG TPA: glycosyltransferase family A protein [Actinomycetota bacterium]